MVYNEPDWDYRVDRRHNRNNRSDRIWFREKSHPRSRRFRTLRLRGIVHGVHRAIPQTSLHVKMSFDHGYFTQYLKTI